jgi:hypothetical protein
MPLVGLEPTIPVFERAKTVHALDRTATVIGDGDVSIKTIRPSSSPDMQPVRAFTSQTHLHTKGSRQCNKGLLIRKGLPS